MHTDLHKIENNINQNENIADTFNAYTKTALFHDNNVEINTTLLKKYYSLDLLQPLPFLYVIFNYFYKKQTLTFGNWF